MAAPKAPKLEAVKTTAVARAKINLPVDVNAAMAQEIADIQKRISAPSGDQIKVTQSKTFKLPNGLEVDDPLEVIIIDFVALNSYYETDFDRNNITPPICFALGLEPAGLSPEDSSSDKQAGSCASCWANQFGSKGKGKACSNHRLLAVIPTDADAETPIWLLKVSATAIRAFDGYVSSIARTYNMPVRGVITELTFSPDSEYATLRFRAIGPAPKDLVMLAQSLKPLATERLLTPPEYSAAAAEQVVKKPASRKPAPKQAAGRSR
jgi:hypothetical protein